MSYFDDRYPGYAGREENPPRKYPTFEQMQTLEKLAKTHKVTDRQREALNTVIRYLNWD